VVGINFWRYLCNNPNTDNFCNNLELEYTCNSNVFVPYTTSKIFTISLHLQPETDENASTNGYTLLYAFFNPIIDIIDIVTTKYNMVDIENYVTIPLVYLLYFWFPHLTGQQIGNHCMLKYL